MTLAQQSAVLHPSGFDTPQPFQSRIEMQNSTLKNQLLQLFSDQIFQYTSHGYFKLTQSYGIAPSMSRRGNSYDNALAESFFGVLKMGCIYRHKPKTLKEANEMIDQYIHFYNHERIQLKIGVAPLTLRHSA